MGDPVATRAQLQASLGLVFGALHEDWMADALEKELWRRGLKIVDRYGLSDSPHIALETLDADSGGLDRARRTFPLKGEA